MFKRLADARHGRHPHGRRQARARRGAGDTVAAALLAAGIDHCRTTPVTGAPRAPYCLMGVCFDCLVTIDGVGNRQACLVPVREGMRSRRRSASARRDDDSCVDARVSSARATTRPAPISCDPMNAADLASYDLVVIGGGPAGLAAAALAARAGVSTVLFDENPGVGGQIYRAITTTPVSDRAILGEDYWAGAALADEAKASGALIVNGATVWSLDPQREVGVSIAGAGAPDRRRRRVIIATGALERPFPIPGWTLPGVMTAGAAQTVLKAQGLRARRPHGDRRRRPAAVAARGADPARRRPDRRDPRHDAARATGCARAMHLPAFVLSPYFAKGLTLLREVRRQGAACIARRSRRGAMGEDKLARGRVRHGAGERRMTADLLLLHQGVVPNVNLAMAAGVEHRWNERQLCFEPVLDEDFGSSRARHRRRRRRRGHRRRHGGGRARAPRGHRRGARAEARARRCRDPQTRAADACSARRWAARSSTRSIAAPMPSASPRATRSSAAARR